MNWMLILFIIIILIVVFHSTGSESLVFLLIMIFIIMGVYKKPKKDESKLKKKLDFFTDPQTSPLEPYFDVIDPEKALEKYKKWVDSLDLSDEEKAQILSQTLPALLSKYHESKTNLLINSPSTAMTLAAYYKVLKKMEELEKDKKSGDEVYWCPVCFTVFNKKEIEKIKKEKGDAICPVCNHKLIKVKSPFTFNFLNSIAAPFSELLSNIMNISLTKSSDKQKK